ncbi:hypothetical protein [Burkholderia pseudomallei]|uniref:hypothetical protein n=1 Tax=Burkholderia pseudomallei TaxID=28450 RepID=UPI00201AF75F|nr:hypothetical protein [Burkholderia pseudomallei]MCL4669034.1 hypothetical protein [Burkholderia pseudomallei]
MSLFRNFISVSDVIGVVANGIAVDDINFDSRTHGAGSDGDAGAFENRFETASKRRLYRTSRAAERLGEAIANTANGQRLRWFDVTLGNGDKYWQSAAACNEGLALLADMASWERVAEEAQRRHARLAGSRWAEPAPPPARFLDMPTMPRIQLIGFNHDELAGFLLDQQIPNSLVVPLPGVLSVTGNSEPHPSVSAGAVVDPTVAGDESTAPSASKSEKKSRAKSAGPRPPMPLPENRDYLSTEEFAAVMGVQPNTILKARHKVGHYCGIRALKLPENRLLRWPAADIKAVLARRAPSTASTDMGE